MRVLPRTRLEWGNLRRDVCVPPGAQPRFSRERGAGGIARSPPRDHNAWGALELAPLGHYSPAVMSRPNVAGKNSNEALPHEIKPRTACTAKGDFIQFPLPGFHPIPSTCCRRDP